MTSDFELRTNLWNLRDRFTDVSLVCGTDKNQEVIRAHKIILAASSTFFEERLSLPEMSEIHFPNMKLRVLVNLVRFVYTGKTPDDPVDLEELIKQCKKLGVKGLSDTWAGTNPNETPLGRKSAENRLDSPESKFSSFPMEVLIKILSYVPTYQLLQNVARVSKRFNTLTKDPDAHISITLINQLSDAGEAIKFLKSKTKVEEIHFTCNSSNPPQFVQSMKISEDFLSSAFSNSKIKVVEIRRPWHLDRLDQLDFLTEVPENAKRLTCLIVNVIEKVKGKTWTNPTSLKHLELVGSWSELTNIGQTSSMLIRLESALATDQSKELKLVFRANKNTLKAVHLPSYNWSDEDVRSLLSCSKLEFLTMRNYRVSPACLYEIGRFENLQGLDIRVNSPQNFLQIVPNLKQLKSLCLRSSGVVDDSVLTSVASLEQLTELTVISKTSIITRNCICTVLSHCSNLTRLILQMEIRWVCFNDMPTIHQPNLIYLLYGRASFDSPKMIEKALTGFPSLRACLQDSTLFVKPNTTLAEICKGFQTSDSETVQFNEVVYL